MVLKFLWTTHALERLIERELTRQTVERAVRDGHPVRETNQGEADWRIDVGSLVVLYDHPVDGDIDKVRVITAWRKRRKRGHRLRLIADGTKELSYR